MAFLDSYALRQRGMAFLALLEQDLRSMVNSWVVRIWALLTAAMALITIPAALAETDGTLASDALAGMLGTYPVIWSTVAILISAGAVAAESGVVADSILSKAVTRLDYISAKVISRLVVVVGLFLLIAVPSAYLMGRSSTSDLARSGVVWGIVLVGIIMTLLTSLAVTLSTLFDRPMVAVVVTWVLWYAAGAIFSLLEIEHLSPVHVVEALPLTLQGDYDTMDMWRTLGLFAGVSVVVSAIASVYFTHKDL